MTGLCSGPERLWAKIATEGGSSRAPAGVAAGGPTRSRLYLSRSSRASPPSARPDSANSYGFPNPVRPQYLSRGHGKSPFLPMPIFWDTATMQFSVRTMTSGDQLLGSLHTKVPLKFGAKIASAGRRLRLVQRRLRPHQVPPRSLFVHQRSRPHQAPPPPGRLPPQVVACTRAQARGSGAARSRRAGSSASWDAPHEVRIGQRFCCPGEASGSEPFLPICRKPAIHRVLHGAGREGRRRLLSAPSGGRRGLVLSSTGRGHVVGGASRSGAGRGGRVSVAAGSGGSVEHLKVGSSGKGRSREREGGDVCGSMF